MARKPDGFEWLGFTYEQIQLLNLIDHVGNNGWARNPQSEALMPNLLGQAETLTLTIAQIKQAMADIGYDRKTLHMLDRWESKRTTGKFGP